MLSILFIEVPPPALLAAYESIQDFKNAADNYCQTIDIQKEARELLKLERSLERVQERNGRER